MQITKREFQKALHAAWKRGVGDARDLIERAAEREELKNVRHSDSLREAAEMLDGLVRRGRGGR